MKRYMKPKVVGKPEVIDNGFVLENIHRFRYARDYSNAHRCPWCGEHHLAGDCNGLHEA